MEKADAETLYADLRFPEGRNGRPYVVINMVTTVDGKATIAGRTKKIGSPFDRRLMRRVRAAADMVMIGSATLKKEEIDFKMPENLKNVRLGRGFSPQIMAATLTTTCDLPLHRRFFQDQEVTSVVFTVEDVDKIRLSQVQRYSKVYFVGKTEPDLNQLMRILVDELGVKRLVLEGGPTLNFHFIEAGVVDELFWTVAPKIVGGSGITMVEGRGLPIEKTVALELVSANRFDSELYLRYRLL